MILGQWVATVPASTAQLGNEPIGATEIAAPVWVQPAGRVHTAHGTKGRQSSVSTARASQQPMQMGSR